MRKVRWGVLSTAKIAREKVIPAMQRGAFSEIMAIASRDESTASRVAAELGIPTAHGTYEALLHDPEIEAIYIPLPNHLHVPWSIRALEAGKHVLCEKPLGLDAQDAQQLVSASYRAPGLKLMEAFMYRFHPQWKRTVGLVRDGSIGTLRSVHTAFAYHNVEPSNIRNRPDTGGGALMDIGCYAVSLSRLLFDAEPSDVQATMETDPELGIDRLTSAVLSFPDGTATFTCSTQLAPCQRVTVFGTRGRIEIEIPFNAPPDRTTRIFLHRDGETETIVFDPVDQYTLQGDDVSRAILRDTSPMTPIEDALANMRVIDAIRISATTEQSGS